MRSLVSPVARVTLAGSSGMDVVQADHAAVQSLLIRGQGQLNQVSVSVPNHQMVATIELDGSIDVRFREQLQPLQPHMFIVQFEHERPHPAVSSS